MSVLPARYRSKKEIENLSCLAARGRNVHALRDLGIQVAQQWTAGVSRRQRPSAEKVSGHREGLEWPGPPRSSLKDAKKAREGCAKP